ncbi:MAG: Cof-type HAD-IIB family hydrolase [Acidobacteriia bacterium]|nr:Cof-type HAD-IIB family hydrolase [Terriglobia bacterium]
MPVRLIALDIDGTLLDDHSRLPESNRRAVAEASARGIEIALVTGRRYDFAMPIARQFPCPLTMIVNNGALVKSSAGETQMVRLLPRGVARRVLDMTSEFREMPSVCFDRPRENQLIFERIDWEDPLRGPYFARNREFISQMSPLYKCLTEDPIQIMFTGSVERARAVESVLAGSPLRSEYSLAATIYQNRDFGMVDVIPAGCSKGSTLAEWVGRRGWSREDVMAIGDNHNDLEMLHYAGLAVVMGNSVPELKSRGWRETLTNGEGGVAAAIEAYALGAFS